LGHDVLNLVGRQLRFAGNGVFNASGQDIGVNVHLLPSEIKSDLHADAVADLVLLVFELW
jgi:hypothetical protein